MLLPSPPGISGASGLLAWVILIGVAIATPIALSIIGGGGAGEGLGLVLAVLAWAGRYAGPAIATSLAPDGADNPLWRVIGGSVAALLFAVAVFALAIFERET